MAKASITQLEKTGKKCELSYIRGQKQDVMANEIEACGAVDKYLTTKTVKIMPNGDTILQLIRSHLVLHNMLYGKEKSRTHLVLPANGL